MEIASDCEPYLKSVEVIAIFQQQNTLLHSKVFDCIRTFKKYFFSMVPLKHAIIPADILLLCAEDAFGKSAATFFDDVKTERFKPDTEFCLAYIKVIFKRSYHKLYLQEVKRKFNTTAYLQHQPAAKPSNDLYHQLNQPDYTVTRVNAVVKSLSREDAETYRLIYIENLRTPELCHAFNITVEALSNKKYRFHKRFKNAWLNYPNKT